MLYLLLSCGFPRVVITVFEGFPICFEQLLYFDIYYSLPCLARLLPF